MPAKYGKAYVQRSKNDSVDAAANCEAATRPHVRGVPLRTVENQAALMRHRVRETLMGSRTRMLNALRGHLAEIGLIAPQGAQNAYALKRLAEGGFDGRGEVVVPDCVRASLAPLVHQIDVIDDEIAGIDEAIKQEVKANATAKRLTTTPGVGPLIASAVMATVPDIGAFKSGREFAA